MFGFFASFLRIILLLIFCYDIDIFCLACKAEKIETKENAPIFN